MNGCSKQNGFTTILEWNIQDRLKLKLYPNTKTKKINAHIYDSVSFNIWASLRFNNESTTRLNQLSIQKDLFVSQHNKELKILNKYLI